MKVIELLPVSQYEIKDRGTVYVIEGLPDGYYDPAHLKGEKVKIYKVRGVERFMIGGISKKNPYLHPYGLLV